MKENPSRTFVTGSRGLVGQALMRAFPDMQRAPSLRDWSEDGVKRWLEAADAEAVIHTAAISDVGQCERDPEASLRANVLLPLCLARNCGERKLVLFSSDQVYTGTEREGPYLEGDARPANTYARHKLEMEERVLEACPHAVILRAQWMYDMPAQRRTYMQLVLENEGEIRMGRQFRGLTWLRELAEHMPETLSLPGGVYNFGSETNLSMDRLTEGLLRFLGRKEAVLPAPPGHNLWMDCGKIRAMGIHFLPVEEALKRCAMAAGLKKE